MAQNQGDANIRESEEVKENSALEQEEIGAGDKLRQDAGMASSPTDKAGKLADRIPEKTESADIDTFMQTAADFKRLARSISDKLDSLPEELRREFLENNTGVMVNNKPLFKDEFIQVIASADLNMSTQSPESIQAFLRKANIG